MCIHNNYDNGMKAFFSLMKYRYYNMGFTNHVLNLKIRYLNFKKKII